MEYVVLQFCKESKLLLKVQIRTNNHIIKKNALKAMFKHTFTVFFEKPLILRNGGKYDVEHNLLPTDVTNHYSGFPITQLGADLWTCYGSNENNTLESEFGFMKFSSVGDRRRGRCCLEQGQLPYLMYWPLN